MDINKIATYLNNLGYNVKVTNGKDTDVTDKSISPEMYIDARGMSPCVSNQIKSGIEVITIIEDEDPGFYIKEAPSVVIDFDINNLDNKELFKRIEKLKLENLELKTEVEYLEKYVEYLETNYSFILKDSKLAKEIFNARTKGGSHE